ncbi:MAG: class A beta-lactamase [Vibrio sp.]
MKQLKILPLLSALLLPLIAFAEPSQYPLVDKQIQQVEQELSARVGVTILDVDSGKLWDHNGDQRFPLTSTFKTIACGKLLNDSEDGQLQLTDTVKVRTVDLVTYSPVVEKYVGKQIELQNACQAAMYMSDNTAANIIIKAVGGTEAVTQFARTLGDKVTRLDRFEPELNQGKPNDERDTTTPNMISQDINALLFGSVLSEQSKQQLKEWMVNNQVTGNLLRSVLPDYWHIADRSGAGGYGSRSITAVVWTDNQSPVIISIYLTQTEASMDELNQAIVEIGKAIFDSLLESKWLGNKNK